jgi:hypothetical protein
MIKDIKGDIDHITVQSNVAGSLNVDGYYIR